MLLNRVQNCHKNPLTRTTLSEVSRGALPKTYFQASHARLAAQFTHLFVRQRGLDILVTVDQKGSFQMREDFYTEWILGSNHTLQDVTRFGIKELDEIYRLVTNCQRGPNDCWLFRMAPSIIARGEIEMLGLSDPRFTHRVLLRQYGPKGFVIKGFVNVRRLRRIIDQSQASSTRFLLNPH